MSSQETGAVSYDRQLLLLGSKRNAVLDMWEVLRYGTDSYHDANYVSIYGLAPAEWYAKGVRLLDGLLLNARAISWRTRWERTSQRRRIRDLHSQE